MDSNIENEVNSSDKGDNVLRWHVMTHLEMTRFREWFDYVNAERLREGLPLIQPFYPYEFLKGRIRDVREVEKPGKKTKELEKADAHREFRRFVFLKGREEDIRDIVYSKNNLDTSVRLRRYLTPEGKQAFISDAEMSRFLQSCMEYRERFELCPAENSIAAFDKVKIKEGLYKGYEATVVRAKLRKGQLWLDLTVPMLTGHIDVLMRDVNAHEVIALKGNDTLALRSDFIRYTQDKLLEIMSQRAYLAEKAEKEKKRQAAKLDVLEEHLSEGMKMALDAYRQEAETLSNLLRYRDYEIDAPSAKAHFKALMLICAHLSKDDALESELQQEVLDLYGQTRKDSDAKAYLTVALKVSTGNPEYRDEAKEYVRRCEPKSERLRRFVKLISKRVEY